ncbi:MAG TPA: aminotransferase class V-fold PLP-dependent enzyme [Acidiferrobacteraceae bacterium]|nr:aminotransferase class V-fold PLP-dependent enzyme [Acidiferrobacteraceae bacterium]
MLSEPALENLLAKEFPVDRELIYLNHAAIAPLPLRTGQAIQDFARECVQEGSRHYAHWQDQETRLREQLRALLAAPSVDDIALVKNTSEGLSMIAYGLHWAEGDEVIITNQEFPSNRIIWESLRNQGVVVTEVNVTDAISPDDTIIDAFNDNTRLLSLSSVQYGSGLRLNLKDLGTACKDAGILFCVDAIQGLGVFPHSVHEMNIDFLVADAHKWLLGPEGIGVFYCAEKWRERLKLHEYGWHMVEHMGDFDRRDWLPASSARRFECGSPNTLGVFAFSASLSLLQEIGIDTVEQRILERTHYLRQWIDQHPKLECLSPSGPGQLAGITTFRHPEVGPETLFKALQRHGLMCAPRGGGIRFSPHCYNSIENLNRAVKVVDSCIKSTL